MLDPDLAVGDQAPTAESTGTSQIVSYSSRFVDKLSDVTDSMNISGSLSIKYGAIGGSGSGCFVDSDKFSMYFQLHHESAWLTANIST